MLCGQGRRLSPMKRSLQTGLQIRRIQTLNTGFCELVRTTGHVFPGIPGYPHDEPMCLDKSSMQWIKDSLADRPVHIDQMYMFSGAWVADLHGTSHSADHTYHVGPHAMMITPHNEDLAKFNRDGFDRSWTKLRFCNDSEHLNFKKNRSRPEEA